MLEIPTSTRTRVIVPIKTDLYMFEYKKAYDEKFLGHIIGKTTFDQIFTNATRVMGNSWSKKRNNDIVRIPRFIIGLAVTSVILTVLYMVFIFLSTSSDNPAMLVLSIICVSLASVIAFGLSIYNFTRKLGRFRTLQEIIREDIEACFAELNKRYDGQLNFVYMMDYAEINILKPSNHVLYEENKAHEPNELGKKGSDVELAHIKVD
jgi:hypothetical protein